jgi:hypothetical protein
MDHMSHKSILSSLKKKITTVPQYAKNTSLLKGFHVLSCYANAYRLDEETRALRVYPDSGQSPRMCGPGVILLSRYSTLKSDDLSLFPGIRRKLPTNIESARFLYLVLFLLTSNVHTEAFISSYQLCSTPTYACMKNHSLGKVTYLNKIAPNLQTDCQDCRPISS